MLVALEWTEQVNSSNILKCSDSVSALASIKTSAARRHLDLLYEILFANSRIAREKYHIHVGPGTFMVSWEIREQTNWQKRQSKKKLSKIVLKFKK